MSERTIFLTALEISSSADREAYLSHACGDDQILRARVQSLLSAHFGDECLLDELAADAERTSTL